MKQEKKVAAPVEEIVVKSNVPTTVYSSPGSTTVVVKDRKGNTRDVDEYNRRYDSRDNDFVMENDTLYINEKEDDGLDGEWVNGEFETVFHGVRILLIIRRTSRFMMRVET